MALVVKKYGGTKWIQHSGYFLRGASSGVTAGSATSTGGEDTHTLTVAEMPSHNHGGATGSMSANTSHSHSYGMYVGASGSGHGLIDSMTATSSGVPSTSSTDINHTHSITAQGSGTAHNNIPKYKSVYIWERTA